MLAPVIILLLLQDTKTQRKLLWIEQSNISKGKIHWKYSEIAHKIQVRAIRIRVASMTVGTLTVVVRYLGVL